MRADSLPNSEIPSAVVPDGDAAFMAFEDDEFKLEVLGERDEVPINEISETQSVDNTLARTSQSQFSAQDRSIPSEEEMIQASTWLEDDDIDED